MRGSFLVFLVLTTTASHTILIRRTILALTALYFFNSGEFLSTFCFFSGALLADLSLYLRAYASDSHSSPPQHHPKSRWQAIIAEHWPVALAMFALFLGTMPPEDQDFVKYSRLVYNFFLNYITAEDGTILFLLGIIVGDVDRTIGAFAGILLIISILFSPLLQRYLSNRYFLFLGSISFPLYLLHGTFIRIPLQWAIIWVLPRIAPDALEYYGKEGEFVDLRCGQFKCKFMASIIFIVWLASLLAFCKVWKKHIDILGIRFSRWAEEFALGKKEIGFNLWRPSSLDGWSLLSYVRRQSSPRLDTEKLR